MLAAMKTHPALGIALVIAAASLWGTTGTAQSFGSGQLPAPWFGALRLAVAALFFAAYVGLVRPAAPTGSAGRLPRLDVIGAGLCMAVYNLAFFAGIRLTGVALGTAVALGSGPIWAGLMQALVQRRRPTPAWWGGTLVAVAGGVMLTLGSQAPSNGFGFAGLGLCLLSGLAYAAYTLFNKRMAAVASAGVITFSAFSVAALVALPLAWAQHGAPVVEARDVLTVAYTGVVTAGVAYLLFSHALRHIDPSTGVTLSLGEPVVAFALSVLVLGETPTALAYAGLMVVLVGVGQVVRQELRAARP
jgi:DME family drug/metabolite transporter